MPFLCVCLCFCHRPVRVCPQPPTWGLEVDASHLDGVGRVVGRDLRVVQQTFCPRLRLFSFAAGDEREREREKQKEAT